MQETKYNSFGQITFDRDWLNGEIVRTKTIIYNEKGLVVDEREQASDGSVVIWEYDSNDSAVKSTESAIDVDGVKSILSITVYTYDSEGRIVKEERLAEDGFIMYYILYTYFPNGNQKTKHGIYADGSEWYYTEYDEKGNIIIDRE